MAGIGIDTPRTNVGDATYLTSAPDFDISQEQSFQSPSKDTNLLQQLRNGRQGAIKTPRSRVPLSDRRNLPNGYGAGEFTPLLKSATRNSAIKFTGGKNGIPQTPAFLRPGGLDNIVEDLSPIPNMGSSMYGDSQNGSYINGTPIPQIESSSAISTPMALLPRRSDGTNPIQDGNQLSLREQENVIDKIEKENFGLKLKIHFLEEALRKSGPGYSEAALKENTELKVDKVTMQKELYRYRKTLTAAERDLELYRQQILEMQEKVKRRHAEAGQKEELAHLQQALEVRDAEVQDLRDQIRDSERAAGQIDKLRDEIGDLEADLREKDRIIEERDDQVDDLKTELESRVSSISELEDVIKVAKRREVELEEQAQSQNELAETEGAIEELEQNVKRLKAEVEEAREDRQEAISERLRAEADLEELQGEMADKSITTKGLGRQIEEKSNRLQDELEELKNTYATLKQEHSVGTQELEKLRETVKHLEQNSGTQEKMVKDLEVAEREKTSLSTKLQFAEDNLRRKTDEKDLLQVRHDALTSESASLQKELAKVRSSIQDLEHDLDEERAASLKIEREVRDQYKSEIDRLTDEIQDLRADIREKERLYDDESDKWEGERRNLQSERDRAEDKAAGLQRTIDKLQETEGTLSNQEMILQQALDSEKERYAKQELSLSRRIEELTSDIETRRQAMEELRFEVSGVSEELRVSQREQKILAEKVEGLEDEIEVLQTTLDDESEQANANIAAAKQEAENLRQEIQAFKNNADRQNSHGPFKFIEIEARLAVVSREKQDLQDQIGRFNVDTHSLRATLSSLEAERDEIRSQLKHLQQQEDTFRLDQEKIDLRTAKMRLDNELRRLRDEVKVMNQQHLETAKEQQAEIDQANADEARLRAEIFSARQKESEYVKREGAQKDVLRTLKRQIGELERRAHELEVSHVQNTSPRPSSDGSVQKAEVIEVRHQLAIAHQSLKDLRSQLKLADVKVAALSRDLEHKVLAWDAEKFTLEEDLERAVRAKDALVIKNTASEKSAVRLRSKIERLEKELQSERHKQGENGDDRTMALERRDLHAMLRDTQIQAESLELAVQKRNDALSLLSNSEAELKSQLKRVRDERNTLRDRAVSAYSQLTDLERKLQAAEEERRRLVRGVRFPNMSVSERGNESILEEAEMRHKKELRGLAMQIEWLRAKCRREEGLRADAAYAKRFMLLQVGLFDECNKADLHLLAQMGISPDRTILENKRPSFRAVAFMVRASIKMKRGAEAWKKQRKVHERLVAGLEVMKRKQRLIKSV